MQPYVLLWLRYTAFLALYPLGVGSELAMVALALPAIRAQRPWSVAVSESCRGGRERRRRCNPATSCLSSGPPSPSPLLSAPPPQMPNALNFGFDYYYACWLAVLAYLPGGRTRRLFGLAVVSDAPAQADRRPTAPLPRCSLHHALPSCAAGFPQLYFYMLAQRRKVLRSGRSSSLAKKHA